METEVEADFDEPIFGYLVLWIHTFKLEIGEDAMIEYFPQLHDGSILQKIAQLISKDVS